MSSPLFRIFLICGAVLTLYVIVSRVRRSKIQMEDAVFWVLLALALVVVAVFPQIAFFFSQAIGFASPSNFVFLLVSAILVVKVFANAAEISLLKHKVNQLSQEIALLEKGQDDKQS